jgi:hypothetical protein
VRGNAPIAGCDLNGIEVIKIALSCPFSPLIFPRPELNSIPFCECLNAVTGSFLSSRSSVSHGNEGEMYEYRVFLLGSDGRIRAAEELMCPSDDEACEHARSILTKCPTVEIWSGDRRVAVLGNGAAKLSSGTGL